MVRPNSRAISSCSIESEAEGVVELECSSAGEDTVDGGFGFVVKEFFGDLESGGVAGFFVAHDAGDAADAFLKFRISGLHEIGDEAGELVEIGVVEAGEAAVAHGAAHDFAEDVAAAFVGRNDAIVNEEGGGAGVIGIDAQSGFGAIVEPRLMCSSSAACSTMGWMRSVS